MFCSIYLKFLLLVKFFNFYKMPNVLMQQLINHEFNFDHFKRWILSQDNAIKFNCSVSDFLTYFLNFIHEEINIEKCGKTSLKPATQNVKQTQEINESSYLSISGKSFENSPRDNTYNSHTSTQNISKDLPHSNLAANYNSPVSPTYKEQQFSTPKYQGVCLGDFLVKSVTKKSNKSECGSFNRKITPIKLNQVQMNGSFTSSNNFNNFNDTEEISYSDTYTNHSFLNKEKIKDLPPKKSDISIVSKEIYFNEQKDEIMPQINLVTYKKQLNVLSDIYVLLLKNKLVLNITAELYFLISLLISKKYVRKSEEYDLGVGFLNEEQECDSPKNNCPEFFENIHNILYFTVRCLELMFDVLKYYDKSTLKSLSLNKRLKEFSPKFSDKLHRISEKKSDRIIEVLENRPNVYYNLDTDTKSNFPSEVSFLAFRKQRDFFYEIIQIWEKNHLLEGWNFQISLGGKIRSLLYLQGDPSNYMHFAKLFKAQLVMSCGTIEMREGLTNEDPLPDNFPSIDPKKLSRLKNRLVTKQSTNGLNSPPQFSGYQEFYKEFILVAANHNFNMHLRDICIAEIIELNEATFDLTGLEEADMVVDTKTRNSFYINLRHLRVLAKFLGFLESLPYNSEVNYYPENMLNCHLKIREKKTPLLDVKQLLLISIKAGTVILTIPWLVKYLSMLDYITLRLPYYLSLYEILFQIYYSYEKPSKKMDYNNALVQFCLGWLFDLPNFPDTEFSRWCVKRSMNFVRTCNTLDDIVIVDQNILYFCCPYLDDIKKILNESIGNCTLTVKHITPVTTIETFDQISNKRLEQQLEEAFFNGQPESVKKTVEFVSERLASVCVKHVCNIIIPSFKKETIKQSIALLQAQNQNMDVTLVRERKTALRTKMTQLAQEKLKPLHEKCTIEVSKVLRERLPICIENLLPIDTLSQTKTACVSIASKLCKERLKEWISCHVTVGIFLKDFEKELNKISLNDHRKIEEEKFVFSLPSNGRSENHDDKSLSAFHLLEKIKIISVDIMENSENVDLQAIVDVVGKAYTTLNSRCDVNDVISASICYCLVDLSLLLIAHRPDMMSQDDMWQLFIKIWRWYSTTNNNYLFNDLLSPKNIILMNDSNNKRDSWRALAEFVALLIQQNVIQCDHFENQCIAFFRRDWKQDIINNVCYFMHQFVKLFEARSNCNQFTMLLEFLAEFCLDM